jgi:putative endonuclease
MSEYSEEKHYVYILTSDNNILYIGVTRNLEGRVYQHKTKQYEGFTKKYNIHRLIYYEEFTYRYEAIMREKQLKKWSRKKKLALIRMINPKFEEISKGWFPELEE